MDIFIVQSVPGGITLRIAVLVAALFALPATATAQDAARPLGILHEMVGRDYMLCLPSKHDLCPVFSRGAAIVYQDAEGGIVMDFKGGTHDYRFFVDASGPQGQRKAPLGTTSGSPLEVGSDHVMLKGVGGWSEFKRNGDTYDFTEKVMFGKTQFILAAPDRSDAKVMKKIEKLRRKAGVSATQ